MKKIIPRAMRNAFRKSTTELRLFDGRDELFVSAASEARVYGEYGCGASTLWVARNTSARILTVDSSPAWIDKVKAEAGEAAARIDARWIDVGEIGEWGRPVSYARKENFASYPASLWDRDLQPDMVLVDGRFRLACFFTSLLRARPGTVIIFDDYVGRPHFHIAADFVPPTETVGRQARFDVPEKLDREELIRLAGKFEYVTD